MGLSLLTVGCDAHTRAWGQVASSSGQPLPEATILVKGWSQRVRRVEPDGTFDLSVVHGGKTRWTFEASGYRSVDEMFKGTGRYRCSVILVPVDAPKKARSKATCEELS